MLDSGKKENQKKNPTKLSARTWKSCKVKVLSCFPVRKRNNLTPLRPAFSRGSAIPPLLRKVSICHPPWVEQCTHLTRELNMGKYNASLESRPAGVRRFSLSFPAAPLGARDCTKENPTRCSFKHPRVRRRRRYTFMDTRSFWGQKIQTVLSSGYKSLNNKRWTDCGPTLCVFYRSQENELHPIIAWETPHLRKSPRPLPSTSVPDSFLSASD